MCEVFFMSSADFPKIPRKLLDILNEYVASSTTWRLGCHQRSTEFRKHGHGVPEAKLPEDDTDKSQWTSSNTDDNELVEDFREVWHLDYAKIAVNNPLSKNSSPVTSDRPHGGIPFLKADIDSPGAGSWLHGDSAMGAVRTLQQQLQGAEAMLATCNQVEAAWALASQRLTAFDSRLSQLDLKLAALSQKQNQVCEDQDTLPRHETDLRLSLLEQRFEALQQRISMPSSPEKDGLGLRLASLSERLSAEARVREEQFRRLESMFRAHQTKESERSPETRTPNAFAGQSSLQAHGSQVESGRPVRRMRPCESADDFWNASLTLPRPQVPLCLAGLSASTPALTSSGAWISNLSPSTLGPSGMPR
ncbi:unnamed protein product, partial [Symbiodinium necroappetens]